MLGTGGQRVRPRKNHGLKGLVERLTAFLRRDLRTSARYEVPVWPDSSSRVLMQSVFIAARRARPVRGREEPGAVPGEAAMAGFHMAGLALEDVGWLPDTGNTVVRLIRALIG